ncbi:MAG: D-tagatose-1,6-bisphosphate aldolase subunit GatY [candidate division BRC1 bacterium ADurb.Bin183]|nr:MAG: D-tagatose-1,6-bisphosphate aldolase subunit GatY [candidate division BRC1 bacterium ADurb.Bin183]
MALVNLRDILADARANKYAVGSFNVVDLASLEAILEAAEFMQSPVILSIAEVHFKYVNLENITPAIKEVARRCSCPVALHLDHGESFEAIMRALRAGFTSIMFDGSKLAFDENIRQTAAIVKMCHAVGVTVEAELGHIGGAEGGSGGAVPPPEEFYTKVDEAVRFVKETKVDALAVAIGTAHGLYKGKPQLDFERLKALNAALNIPLVLHGGTGLSNDDFARCIENGVAKINFYTGMSVAATERIKDKLKSSPESYDYPGLLLEAKAGICRTVSEQIDIFRSKGMCAPDSSLCSFCSGCVIPRKIHAPVGAPAPAAAASDGEALVKKIADAVIDVLRQMKK